MSWGIGAGGQNSALRLQCGSSPLKVAVKVASPTSSNAFAFSMSQFTSQPEDLEGRHLGGILSISLSYPHYLISTYST